MALEEEQLNGRIASIISELARTTDWRAREELGGALQGRRTKPDILITRPSAPPIVVENEYYPATTLHDDCMKSIGRDLNAKVAGEGTRVGTVVGIRSPLTLKRCSTGDEARRMLMDGEPLEYAVYQSASARWTRFPRDGFITGDVRNLIEFIRPAAVPNDAISKAAQALTNGAQYMATKIVWQAEQYGYESLGMELGEELRQPWPTPLGRPPQTKEEVEQEKADHMARYQTAKMCATIIINALAYHQNLAGYQGIRDFNRLRDEETYDGRLHKYAITGEWKNILAVNYWPIFHIAMKLLAPIPPLLVDEILPSAISAAASIRDAVRQNDVAGIVFQRLIADRQTLATYYTRPESTVLAAHLAVPEDLDWSDPETLKSYHIADYACGTGGLILAAYQRARELHRNHGGNPDTVHAHMMERALTACDIMPAAVHLSSSLLSFVAPRQQYKGTRNVLYPFGGVRVLDDKGKQERDDDGNPIIEKDKNGRPVVDLGSLDLLDLSSTKHQIVLPLSEQMALGPKGRRNLIEVEMAPLSQSLVIMNPPFTTPTNHAADHVDTKNPAFAAFGTSEDEQESMERKLKRLSKGTVGDGYAGLGSQFAAIADNMVKPDGHIALILPVSSMMGGSYDGRTVRSWQKFRRMLAEHYNDIIVVTIVDLTSSESAFSADTDLSEALIVARRLGHGERPRRTAHFVNLMERPGSTLAAQEISRLIRKSITEITAPGTHTIMSVGPDVLGSVRLEVVHRLEKWTTVRVANIDLVRRARQLANGSLSLPQRIAPIAVPIVKIGQIGKVGPVHRLIQGAFEKRSGADAGTEYPMLWNHDKVGGKKTQDRMATPPDSAGVIKPGKAEDAERIWEWAASHLHINSDFRFNANSTSAAFTPRKSAGGRAWPSIQMDSPELEKATCVWLNGTLGIIGYWMESNRTQNGRGSTTVSAIPNIPTLDVTSLPSDRLSAAVRIYDDLCETRMLPANESHHDPVRQELDRRLLTEVLALDDRAVEQLDILRNQWCLEPTVVGTKKTGIDGGASGHASERKEKG